MDRENRDIEPRMGVIFEDGEILILDKPSGMTVNRSETTKRERTVQDWIKEEILRDKDIQILSERKEKAPNILVSQYPNISDFVERSGIVHRLDKETSGVLIVGKTPSAFENLQRQFKERRVKKVYIALVHGKVQPSQGEIRVPVGRLPWNRKRFGVVAGGRDAVTRYKVQSSILRQGSGQEFKVQNEEVSLLELYPETGRTHQIRVHLKYAGHPVFSDPLYGGRKQARADRKILPRLFLHAAKITFTHPKTGERVTFESPLPEELGNLMTETRS